MENTNKSSGGTVDRLNNKRIPSKEEIENRKQKWISRRVVLDGMDDVQAPAAGTQALVTDVDGVGDLICDWDSGSGLKLIFGEDDFHIIASDEEIIESLSRHKVHQEADKEHMLRCPRCGGSLWKDDSVFGNYPALSRLADVKVCSECGAEEALIIAVRGLKEQGIRLNISGASDKTKENLKREKLTDWWLVREWRGQ